MTNPTQFGQSMVFLTKMTVGFGDIAAENTAEMLFCILAEWTGALVFAFIISQVSRPPACKVKGERAFFLPPCRHAVVSNRCPCLALQQLQRALQNASAKSDAQREELEGTVAFLRKYHCPHYLIERVRHWIHFTYRAKIHETERGEMLAKLPSSLSHRLVLHMNDGVLLNLDIFQDLRCIQEKKQVRFSLLASLTCDGVARPSSARPTHVPLLNARLFTVRALARAQFTRAPHCLPEHFHIFDNLQISDFLVFRSSWRSSCSMTSGRSGNRAR